MIERIYDKERLYPALGDDVFSGKIWALCEAYGFSYDFCAFFMQEGGAVIGGYYGNAIVYCGGEIPDVDELKDFLRLPVFRETLMSAELCDKIGLSGAAEHGNLMRFEDRKPRIGDIAKEAVDNSPPIGKVYEILKDGFDIDYSLWYTDISHNLRHGISETYVYGEAATVTKMFTYKGTAFLSFVAAAEKARGTGAARALVRRVCLNECESGNDVCLICRDAVVGFYEKCGLVRIGGTAVMKNTD